MCASNIVAEASSGKLWMFVSTCTRTPRGRRRQVAVEVVRSHAQVIDWSVSSGGYWCYVMSVAACKRQVDIRGVLVQGY